MVASYEDVSRRRKSILMPSETPLSTVTAHTLFLDIVGFSLLSNEEAVRQKTRLGDLVREALTCLSTICTEDMIRRDTGDGLAVIFLKDPTSALRCALAIAKSLGSQPDLRLRIGLHIGAGHLVTEED